MRSSKKKLEKGAVTVEATISLTAFMFAIITVLTVLNICTVQAKIANAINLTAREISQYSYLYSLTGMNGSLNKVKDSAKSKADSVTSTVEGVMAVYNGAMSLAGDVGGTLDEASQGNVSTSEMKGALNGWASQAEDLKNKGSEAYSSVKDLVSDPKSLMFGFAQMAASDGITLGDSLLSSFIAKGMCARHLVNVEKGDTEEYLKKMRVVPKNGSYLDGLDFTGSRIFSGGSNEIKISVEYDVKLIDLLPIDFTFHFKQTAITYGWSCGDVDYSSFTKYVDNDTLWTNASIHDRSSLIRKEQMERLKKEGYLNVCNMTDVQLYDPKTQQFIMIKSMNPLYSGDGEPTLTVEDLNEAAIRQSIEQMCAKMKSNTDGNISVKVKDGDGEKSEYSVEGASNKIVLVIPEDKDLKEKIQEIIDSANTNGVEIELIAEHGNGASRSVAEPQPTEGEESD